MALVVTAIYGVLALAAFLNLILMRRPSPQETQIDLVVLIPARDEETNLDRLLPALAGAPTIVFDDESTDRTAEVATKHGATVIRGGPLPKGWTGKNRACHALASAAIESTTADWLLFLDADVRPSPDFVSTMRAMAAGAKPNVGAITGFPTILPGRGIEPLFLAWVGWILLATNPYGLVARTRMGHNRFLNGQVTMWRRDVYARLWPNEAVRSRVMEDVSMGRLLAKEGVFVEVANLSKVLAVKMYDTWRQTLDGMSKNSHEVAGTTAGTLALAALMLFLGWAWILGGPWAGCLFWLSGLCVVLTCRAPVWPVLLIPLVPTIGAFTLVRSLVWHRQGRVMWKGRTYGGTGR
ncbi:glycosyltransferase [bacterium]|nr:MAG: glycosyltransferase [bacterium]